MRKTIILLITILFTFSVMAAVPDGASGPWADEVISFNQGLRHDGSPVDVDRSNPNQSLGIAEDSDTINFVALGYGGELILKFDNAVVNGPGDDLEVVETTFNDGTCASYPEKAEVYVSADGITWAYGGNFCKDAYVDLGNLQLECIQYVKIVDITNFSEFPTVGITDAYDVDGVRAINTDEEDCIIEEPLCNEEEINLIAGQHIDVGSVMVWNNEEELSLMYVTENGWEMTEVHLSVECSEEDIPQNKKGNPKPGHFTYVEYFDPAVTEFEQIINMFDLTCEELYVAAHAVVQKIENEEVVQEETAWGEGTRFVNKGNWAMYFTYDATCEDECVSGIIWQIGDEETSQLDSPMDEFNYPGYGLKGGKPAYDDPFIVGTSLTEDFPWNSNVINPYATDFDVIFDLAEETTNAKLVVSWSPGKSANEQKEVFLDTVSLGTTPIRLGVPVAGWYNTWAVYQDEFVLGELLDGTHTLNFQHLMGDGTAWDYVRLEEMCEE